MNKTTVLFLFEIIFVMLQLVQGMVIDTTQDSESSEKQSPLFSGWHYKPQQRDAFFPRTDNYYFRIKPESVVEILMDPVEDEPAGPFLEHSSITTSIQTNSEYKSSCVREPGCRWECEPRHDELPPDCDCVCFYTDAKWDKMP